MAVKYFLIIISAFLLATFVRAQTALYGPFTKFASASAQDVVVQPDQMNIAYYWNSLDIPSNTTTINWTDRIQGIVAVQTVSANRGTNSYAGQRFDTGATSGTFYHLTNFLNILTNSTLTNVACFIAYKWDANVNNSYTILSDTNMEALGNDEGGVYIRKAAGSVLRVVGKGDVTTGITQSAVPLNVYQDVEFGGADQVSFRKAAYTNAVLTGLNTTCFTNITDFGGTNVNAGQSQGFSGWISLIAIYTNSVWTAKGASNVNWYRTNLPPLGRGL